MSGGLLTTRDAAARLGVSPARVRKLIQDGRLVAIRPGRELLIEEAVLEAFSRVPRKRTGRPRKK